MQASIAQPALQRQTLRLYGEFLSRAPQWGGKLVVACFEGAGATGWAAAASLAGAASLTVDSDAAKLKLHFRDGAFDFLVNTLDEALRALKNEVRKGRPLAIALHGDPAATAEEMRKRGVVADLSLRTGDAEDEAQPPAVLRVSLDETEGSASSREWLKRMGWSVQEVAASQLRTPKQEDIAGATVADDLARGRWVRDLSKHQRSVSACSTRVVWLSQEDRLQVAL